MNAPVLLGPGGAPLRLGVALGGGGEGTVYALTGSAEVAKVYRQAPPRERADKLAALVALATPELRTIAAWPHELVRLPGGGVAGFTMPRVEGRLTVASAMNPGSRKAKLPQANWAWLVHVARNLAATVETLHRAGVVIGDVNDSNVLVGPDAVVRLIDVDSFQVHSGARLFTCDVGMPIYQPPELFGRGFTGLARTPNHDRFGLAVLLFQLVFLGRHPWAGIWRGPEYAFETGELIARLPFAFGREARALGFAPPPNTVRLDWIPEATGALFEQAFARGAAARPSGADWAAALADFERALRPCPVSPLHRYLPERGPCPWCALERRGVFLFVAPGVAAPDGGAYLDVAALERLLAELPPLDAAPLPADPDRLAVSGEPLEPPLRRRRRLWLGGLVLALVLAVVVTARLGASPWDLALYSALASLLVPARAPIGAAERRRFAARDAAYAAFGAVAREWHASTDLRDLAGRRAELQAKLAAYRGLAAKFTAERAWIEADKPHQQLRAFLSGYLLEDTAIPGIGKRRKATLRSYGIDSALDVKERMDQIAIPGFGAGRRGALRSWVFVLERMFRYDPSQPVDPALLADLRAREQRERYDLERDLRGGPQALAAVVEQRLAQREGLRIQLTGLAERAAKARADVAALRRF